MAERVIHVGGERIRLTDHVVERWHERCRPALSLADAERDLIRIADTVGRLLYDPPGWLVETETEMETDASRWVMIGDDVAVAVAVRGRHHVAVTCITRGDISDTTRSERREHRRRRSRTRQVIRGGGRGDKSSVSRGHRKSLRARPDG